MPLSIWGRHTRCRMVAAVVPIGGPDCRAALQSARKCSWLIGRQASGTGRLTMKSLMYGWSLCPAFPVFSDAITLGQPTAKQMLHADCFSRDQVRVQAAVGGFRPSWGYLLCLLCARSRKGRRPITTAAHPPRNDDRASGSMLDDGGLSKPGLLRPPTEASTGWSKSC
jgi:hypothetical protein